jgi:diguanylate cyclase (GGDEF)-like protein/PAS domain S-box-containing protein
MSRLKQPDPPPRRRDEGFLAPDPPRSALENTLEATNARLVRQIAERDLMDGQRRAVEQDLHDVQARFESAFTSAPIGMALVDGGGRWLQVNDALCRILGRTRNELMAATLHEIAHPEDVDRDEHSFRDLLLGKIPSYQVEKRYRHAFGHYFWALLTVSLVRDQLGTPLYLVSQFQDISDRKDMAARMEHLIDHDFLTGLFNRRHFQEEVAHQAERMSRYGSKGAILMIDLDNFKNVNDSFGHKAGDDLLRGVAGALRHQIRETDILARVGGDEFAVLLPETDDDHARLVAEGIVKTLSRQVAVLGDQTIHITASVGIALFDGSRAVEVLEFADLAMYEAKAAGRNQVVAHRAGAERGGSISKRTEVELIRTALEEHRLLLHCQPIRHLWTNDVNRYELLVRVRADGVAEPLLPGSFLYVAERFNLIQEIDCWVTQQAIAAIVAYGQAGLKLMLHVNLSGKSIGDPRVATLIEESIAKAGIDPACLTFEVTETTAISNLEGVKDFADRLRARGCALAIDDFGAGFGSFYYLKSLTFDYFKIDGDFVRGLVENRMDQLVVEAIVGIARGTGKQTIAEFVPDEETSLLLAKLGVDHAQGYHIGKPRPLRDVLPLTSSAER